MLMHVLHNTVPTDEDMSPAKPQQAAESQPDICSPTLGNSGAIFAPLARGLPIDAVDDSQENDSQHAKGREAQVRVTSCMSMHAGKRNA